MSILNGLFLSRLLFWRVRHASKLWPSLRECREFDPWCIIVCLRHTLVSISHLAPNWSSMYLICHLSKKLALSTPSGDLPLPAEEDQYCHSDIFLSRWSIMVCSRSNWAALMVREASTTKGILVMLAAVKGINFRFPWKLMCKLLLPFSNPLCKSILLCKSIFNFCLIH